MENIEELNEPDIAIAIEVEKITPLDDEAILGIVAEEMSSSQTGTGEDSSTVTGHSTSLDYYLGLPRGDEQEGRSSIVSTDVADAIEWIIPQIMKAMIAKGSVIEFDSLGPEDEEQAKLETDFTHDIFMKENNGFLNLHEFVKDALMQNNGVFKIYYDDSSEVTSEQYDGLTKAEFTSLLQNPEIELVKMTEQPNEEEILVRQDQLAQMESQLQQAIQQMPQEMQPMALQMMQTPDAEPTPETAQAMQMMPEQMQVQAQQMQQMMQQFQQASMEPMPTLISCEVEVIRSRGRIKVDCVALEEFRINKRHDSLNLDDARFTAHVRECTRSDLLEQGYNEDIINNASPNLTNYLGNDRFTAQGEDFDISGDNTSDSSQDLLEISECYMMIDVEGTGRAKLMQIVTLGSNNPTDILEVTPLDESPFVSSTAIIMSHKFKGLSIYDRLVQLQDMKTSMWRNILDNLYLQNNREKEVVESQVNIDDLLVSRPGGIKRVKQPGMIRELQVQPIGQEGYQMLDYLDQVRTGRVGVSPDTAGQINAMGTSVGSEGIARMQTAKEELTGLMVRVVAETGMKPAYMKIRNLLVKYQNNETAFKFKDRWINVNPSDWGYRSRTTVNVGTGTGDDQRKSAAIQQVIAYQAQLVQDPRNTLVDQPQLFESLDEFCRSAGLQGASPYFLDPSSEEGQNRAEIKQGKDEENKQKQDAIDEQMVEAQKMLGEAEQMKGQAALQSQQAKIQIESGKAMLEGFKQQAENDKAKLQMQLDEAKALLSREHDNDKIELEYAKLRQAEALTLTQMEIDNKRELNEANEANKAGTNEFERERAVRDGSSESKGSEAAKEQVP